MSITDNYSNRHSPDPEDFGGEPMIDSILSSDKWREYFQELSGTLGLEVGVYDFAGNQLQLINESPFCRFSRSANGGKMNCPGSCYDLMKADEHSLFRCESSLLCFSFPVALSGEKAYIIGRGGFSEYEDLLRFLKKARQADLPEVPVSTSLNFIDEDYMKSASRYLSLSINRQLKASIKRNMLEEKLLRVTSLFDAQAFGTLSKKPELMYRYILDTIDFVFGPVSAVVLTGDEEGARFRPVYAVGKHREGSMELLLESDHPAIKSITDAGTGQFIGASADAAHPWNAQGVESAYVLPLFAGGKLEAVIGIINRKLAREDTKILNAFREYIQLNLENRNLQTTAKKGAPEDKKLAYLADITKSITSILDKDRLLNELLEKSLQLVNAEQGSLMILDNETSELVVEAKRSLDDTVKDKMRLSKSEGISGLVLDNGGAILVEDIEKDPRFQQLNRARYKTKSFVSIPIKIEERLKGILNLSDKAKDEIFNNDDLNLIESFVSNTAIAIERSLLYKQTETLQKLSITDPLTGIYNRRYLNKRLSEEITRFNRYKHPFSFMMLDLDKFKEYNDTFGHIAGDNLIKTLATTMDNSLRTIDIAARFGGDEFVAIFPQTPKPDAVQISSRLKEKIEMALEEHNTDMPLKISVGLTTFPEDASSIMELIDKTDQALYIAKKGGGNRVVYL